MKAINLFIIFLFLSAAPAKSLFAHRFEMNDTLSVQSGLKVGDKVPDILIEHIDNYQSKSARLSAFKGKLIILDFWAIWCGPCVAALPKMDSLQTEFKNDLQVLLVSEASSRKLDSLLTLGKKIGRMDRKLATRSLVFEKLVSVTSDTQFNNLFPHTSLPHYVWIDQNLKVIAFTEGYDVNKENIKKFLARENLDIEQKTDLLSFDHKSNHLPQLLKADKNSLKMYSSIIGYVPGLGGGSAWFNPDSTSNTVRIRHGNLSILGLFGMAYTGFRDGDPLKKALWDYGKRVQLVTADSGKYFPAKSPLKSYRAWALKHVYSYESVIPLVDQNTIISYFKNDIEKFFNIDSKIEIQVRNSYAIVRTSDEDKISFKGDASKLKYVISYGDDNAFNLYGGTMETLRAAISKANINDKHLFIDKSGFEGRLQMQIKAPLSNIKALKKELNEKYDLDLVEVEVPVEILVLKDR